MLLAPLGALYATAVRARRALYRTGLLRAHQVNAPVISVGNITAGGTGKTPLVESIARMVASEGKRACILTRGYGRKDPGRRVVVSDGQTVLADARTSGDEAFLLAEKLLGVAAVISDANRTAAARWAIANLASEVFILDDGFQHLALARDLDILVIDASNPFGGGRLLPRGRLREPLNAMERAGCFVITRSNQTTELASLRETIKRFVGAKPIITSHAKTVRLKPLAPSLRTERVGMPQPVGAFSGIGNPQSFIAHLKLDGHAICYTSTFADHYDYRQAEIDEVITAARAHGANALVTTAKDAVKLRSLRFDLPCYVLEIELEFSDEPALRAIVRSAIAAKPVPAS
jgi:tetraacyldisaccharide 4'-kinase